MNWIKFVNFFSPARSEIAENSTDKVLSSEEENSSVHRAYVNFPTSRKSALDVPLYAISSGRSMVEMLGVLAIIGVLSVGAMTGYSKAMLKYKLNKQTEQLNSILTGIILHRHEWRTTQGSIHLKNYFVQLGFVPEDMDQDNTDYLYDVFNNKVSITTSGRKDDGTMTSVGVSYDIDTSASFEVCQNIYQTVKGFADNLYRINIGKTIDGASGTSYSTSFYGKQHCANHLKCLANISVSDIYETCQFCKDSKTCNIWFSTLMDDF